MEGLHKSEFEIIYKNKIFPLFLACFLFIYLPCIFRSSFWETNDSRKKRENRKGKRHIKIENNF